MHRTRLPHLPKGGSKRRAARIGAGAGFLPFCDEKPPGRRLVPGDKIEEYRLEERTKKRMKEQVALCEHMGAEMYDGEEETKDSCCADGDRGGSPTGRQGRLRRRPPIWLLRRQALGAYPQATRGVGFPCAGRVSWLQW